jgi:hypothetical protein
MYGIWFSGEGLPRLQSTDMFRHSHLAIARARETLQELGPRYVLIEVYDLDSGDIIWIEERA